MSGLEQQKRRVMSLGPYLVILRHRLPIVHEEDFQRVWDGQPHLRPSCPIVVFTPPFSAAPALFAPPSSRLWATSRRGSFRGRSTGRSGGGLSPGQVLLEGKVGLVEFEEARRGDPLVPAVKEERRNQNQSAGKGYSMGRTSASSLCSAQDNEARHCLVLCLSRPKSRI